MEWTYYKEHRLWAEPFHTMAKAYMKYIKMKKWYIDGDYTIKDYEIDLNETEFSLLKFEETYIKGEFVRDILWDFDIDDRYVSVKIEVSPKPLWGPIVIREINGKKLRLPYLIAPFGRKQEDIDNTLYDKIEVVSIEPTDTPLDSMEGSEVSYKKKKPPTDKEDE